MAAGAVAGMGALVLGFVTAVALVDPGEHRERVAEVVGPDGPAGTALSGLLPEWYHVAGWLYFDSHRVDVSVSVGETLAAPAWVDEYAETLLPTAAELQVVPPLLLVSAGALVALHRSRTGPVDAALAGATVVLGYLPGVAVLAAVAAFEVTVLGEVALVDVRPAFRQAVLVAGLAYPLAFGCAGGLLGYAARRSVRASRG